MFKQEYINLPKHEGVFNNPLWLDLVCGHDDWNVIVAISGNKKAYLPYWSNGAGALTPGLTGHFIVLDERGEECLDINLLCEITKQIRKNKFYNLKILAQNFAPFVWEGESPVARVTYVIENLDQEDLFKKYNVDLRNLIRKSERIGAKKFDADETEIKEFLDILIANFQTKKIASPFPLKKMQTILSKTIKSGSGKLILGKVEGEVQGGVFLLSDSKRTCYLLGATTVAGKKNHLSSFLIHESIKETLSEGRVFDFEGSSIPSIGKFFKDFGGQVVPIWMIQKKAGVYTRLKRKLNLI